MANGFVQKNPLEEIDWLAKYTKRSCQDFRHLIYLSETQAAQTDHSIVSFRVPKSACWVVTCANLRAIPSANGAPFNVTDWTSDESLDPVAERNSDIPYGRAWWQVNGNEITPQSAVFRAIFTTPYFLVFNSEVLVELKFTANLSTPSLTELICVINSYTAPAECYAKLAMLNTQFISHTNY